MLIQDKLSEMHFLLFLKMLPDMLFEYWNFSANTVRCHISRSPEKLLTEILMTTHAIEKAFSIYRKKNGFGVNKIRILVSNIRKYISKYGYSEDLETPIALVYAYFSFQESQDYNNKLISDSRRDMDVLLEGLQKTPLEYTSAGFLHKSKTDMLKLKEVPFKELALGRYSFRHFGEGDVTDEEIRMALEIAKKSPSACNRQAYRVHVFTGADKDRALKIQGGANSFSDEVNKAILITGNMNRYYTMEKNLPYVDASLFAMSLIYAFTSMGIASIPLTMGRRSSVLNCFHKELNIPENEVLVILIGIGQYPDEAEVSVSNRNDVETFTAFH